MHAWMNVVLQLQLHFFTRQSLHMMLASTFWFNPHELLANQSPSLDYPLAIEQFCELEHHHFQWENHHVHWENHQSQWENHHFQWENPLEMVMFNSKL